MIIVLFKDTGYELGFQKLRPFSSLLSWSKVCDGREGRRSMGERRGSTFVRILVVALSLSAFGFAIAAERRRSTVSIPHLTSFVSLLLLGSLMLCFWGSFLELLSYWELRFIFGNSWSKWSLISWKSCDFVGLLFDFECDVFVCSYEDQLASED